MEQNKNFNWISSLRGIGAFLVFFSHLPIIFPNDLGFVIGRIGVVIFLMMSGYLAVSSRFKYTKKEYLFNRFVRMYPVYWVLLIIITLLSSDISLVRFLTNITLFSKFMGQPEIIGASWMMPIQVVFFVIIAFFSKKSISTILEGNANLIINKYIYCWGVIAIILAILRMIFQKPFPVALALLIIIAFLGVIYRYDKTRNFIKCLILFEFILLVSVYMAYHNSSSYFIAYNLGIILFIIADYKNINFILANKLGKISFTFFLGGDISAKIIYVFIDKNYIMDNILAFCILQFLVDILLAFLITKYIESPLYKKSNQILYKYKNNRELK